MPRTRLRPERTPPDPRDIAVQLNIKIPYHYREQLIATAEEQKTSLSRLVATALVRAYPPKRQ